MSDFHPVLSYMILLSAHHQLPTHRLAAHRVIGHPMWVSPRRATVSALRCYPQKLKFNLCFKNIEGIEMVVTTY